MDASFGGGLRLDDLNGTTVVGTALRAHSVALAQRAALRAHDQRRSRQLPMRAAPLIASRAGYFPLRDCHDDTSLIESGIPAAKITKAAAAPPSAGPSPFCSGRAQD